MRSLGICVGASTLTVVCLERDHQEHVDIRRIFSKAHNGNPRQILTEAMDAIPWDQTNLAAATGRRFRHFVNLPSISEPEAVELALKKLNGHGRPVNAIISIGAETFLIYVIGQDGKINSVQTGSKCASGTGEFYVQQLRRMGITLEEAVKFSMDDMPYQISGRCSVFCKSDCTHALNKGVPKARIASGLCRMMTGKVLEILRKIPKKDIMVIGGTTRNRLMMDFLKSEISNLVIPEEATYFEALGAGLWALDYGQMLPCEPNDLFKRERESFHFLPPLVSSQALVQFKKNERGNGAPQTEINERCIIGLDVGSTTTKAVLMNESDCRVLASVYLRTNGDPIHAARQCYAEIERQMENRVNPVRIIGLGVTGSGRQIAGLHAMTDGIINEIIAHATGARYYDPEVDTILEIGGQDAKYTHLTNGVPTDYAMNDACSAGTGSFLEEAAKESLAVDMERIADYALAGMRPPNFNDQCAAFIGSDIKNAAHEGIEKEDILAGLVYSIAMNYNSRVRGNRPIGQKIFMQGGVCYNKAVPMAMASLTGKEIIVPPEPGLMGAFGVALEIKNRMALGLIKEGHYSLSELKNRDIHRKSSFICQGGKEKCDRKCEIARLVLEGETYAFGGACNRWYNIRSKIKNDADELNFAGDYEKMIFERNAGIASTVPDSADSIGINKSFLTDLFYPLYHHFFTQLGFKVILSQHPDQEGIDYKSASFCYSAEVAHGFFHDLLKRNPNYLFIPHIKGIPLRGEEKTNATCPVCQAEPYILSSAFQHHETFRRIKKEKRLLAPVIDFSCGLEKAEPAFVNIGKKLGVNPTQARTAFAEAIAVQKDISRKMRAEGLRFLQMIEDNPEAIGIVILGRSYNAYVPETNMGIPRKFASRGFPVIPCDYLPLEEQMLEEAMYWSSGQIILKAASYIASHDRIFGCYVTNFSCGPDSFLVGYARDRMGRKPFLVLELDSHVADAGLETRIEAFIDIIKNNRAMRFETGPQSQPASRKAKPAYFDPARSAFIDSHGGERHVTDPSVHMVIPSMGPFTNEAAAAVFRGWGIRATALKPSDPDILKLGQNYTTCKECLPLILTTGSLIQCIRERNHANELLVYFMPTASGPCRFGQYSIFLEKLIKKRQIENVALYSLSAENSYGDFGFGKDLTAQLFASLIVSDMMQDTYSVILANAVDRKEAVDRFRMQWKRILHALEDKSSFDEINAEVGAVSEELRRIPVKRTLAETPIVLICGEIFVRNDEFSHQFLVQRLAEQGFAVKLSGLIEWLYYTDWCFQRKLSGGYENIGKKIRVALRSHLMHRYEKVLKKTLVNSGLYPYKIENTDKVIGHAKHLISAELLGEAILTVGSALHDILEHVCGVIAVGPFGCMPNRIAESVLTMEMNREGKIAAGANGLAGMKPFNELQELPFLAIESDGNPFPQIVTAKLEAFMLQAERIHETMRRIKYYN